MGCPFVFGDCGNFHRVGTDDADDDDLGARGERFVGGDGVVFDGAIELVDLNLADAGPGAGDR